MPRTALDPLMALAEVATPAGRHLPAPTSELPARVRALVGETFGEPGLRVYEAALTALEWASVPVAGGRLSRLPFDEREEALRRLARGSSSAWLVRVATAPLKAARAEHPELLRALGIAARRSLPRAEPPPRWAERATDARSLGRDEELEAEAVVVGTGAGGAAVASALAARGHAVVMIEEGGFFRRESFNGALLPMQKLLYRDAGLTGALGDSFLPIPLGKTVGGTTTINSGTCYRVPDSVQRRWVIEEGLIGLGPGSLDPYFDRVEKMLEVAPAQEAHLNGSAHVVARGAEALGYAHGPLSRNAPGCDGQGVCCFGCPTDAKRSTNLSYVPSALKSGAMLFYHAEVERVLLEGGRAAGVVAKVHAEDGRTFRLTVRAPAVVLACGAIHTPALLLRNGLANSSGKVGEGLTVHPANYAWGLFEEKIRGWEGIPQGYCVEEFAEQGLRFEGGFPPLALASAATERVGRGWTEMMESFDRLAFFGFLIADRARGRVRLGPTGSPLVSYRLAPEDLLLAIRGQGLLARMYFAAGARKVYPGLRIFDELGSLADVERLEREGPSRLRASDLDMSAYHPLGSCRMGADPRRSVVGPDHQCHDVEGLFICDGSAVPGPLGVNPQVTIMAFSERAAAFVEERIEGRGEARSAGLVAIQSEESSEKIAASRMKFEETMSGSCELVERGGGQRRLLFHVRGSFEPELRRQLEERGGTMSLAGELYLEGFATHVPCEGRLIMRPLESLATLTYELDFQGDGGEPFHLRGQKNVLLRSALSGMTTLYTEVLREGAPFAQGVLRFDLRDLGPWLRSFRWAA